MRDRFVQVLIANVLDGLKHKLRRRELQRLDGPATLRLRLDHALRPHHLRQADPRHDAAAGFDDHATQGRCAGPPGRRHHHECPRHRRDRGDVRAIGFHEPRERRLPAVREDLLHRRTRPQQVPGVPEQDGRRRAVRGQAHLVLEQHRPPGYADRRPAARQLPLPGDLRARRPRLQQRPQLRVLSLRHAAAPHLVEQRAAARVEVRPLSMLPMPARRGPTTTSVTSTPRRA